MSLVCFVTQVLSTLRVPHPPLRKGMLLPKPALLIKGVVIHSSGAEDDEWWRRCRVHHGSRGLLHVQACVTYGACKGAIEVV